MNVRQSVTLGVHVGQALSLRYLRLGFCWRIAWIYGTVGGQVARPQDSLQEQNRRHSEQTFTTHGQ